MIKTLIFFNFIFLISIFLISIFCVEFLFKYRRFDVITISMLRIFFKAFAFKNVWYNQSCFFSLKRRKNFINKMKDHQFSFVTRKKVKK